MERPDEGYIKFKSTWDKQSPFSNSTITALNKWRDQLYDAKLIGAYSDGIGYGNISHRAEGNTFYISGSATGNLSVLDESHYSKVVNFDLSKNELRCVGPIIASSESMSHAVIYQELNWVNTVFHVHNLELWEQTLHKIPTTLQSAAYGTPDMAREIIRLIRETNVASQKVFAMAGHQEGLISFGADLEDAGSAIFDLVGET